MNFTDVQGTWKQIKAYIDTKISSSGADSLPVGTLLTSVNNKNVFGDNFKLCDGKIYALNVDGLTNVDLSTTKQIDFSKASLCAKYGTSNIPSVNSIYMIGDKLYIGEYYDGIICFDFKTEKFNKLFDTTYGSHLDYFYIDRIINVGSQKNTSPYYWQINVVKSNGESISYKITDISVWYIQLYVAWFNNKYILFIETNSNCYVRTTTDFQNFEEIYKTDTKTKFNQRMVDSDHLFFTDINGYICLINKDFSIKKYAANTGSYVYFQCLFNNILYYIDNSYYSDQFHMLNINTGDNTLSGMFKNSSINSNFKYYNVFQTTINNNNYLLISNIYGAATLANNKNYTFEYIANAIYPYGDYIYILCVNENNVEDKNFYMYKMYKNSQYLPEIKNTFCKIK